MLGSKPGCISAVTRRREEDRCFDSVIHQIPLFAIDWIGIAQTCEHAHRVTAQGVAHRADAGVVDATGQARKGSLDLRKMVEYETEVLSARPPKQGTFGTVRIKAECFRVLMGRLDDNKSACGVKVGKRSIAAQ